MDAPLVKQVSRRPSRRFVTLPEGMSPNDHTARIENRGLEDLTEVLATDNFGGKYYHATAKSTI
jgi:hypothetical protein